MPFHRKWMGLKTISGKKWPMMVQCEIDQFSSITVNNLSFYLNLIVVKCKAIKADGNGMGVNDFPTIKSREIICVFVRVQVLSSSSAWNAIKKSTMENLEECAINCWEYQWIGQGSIHPSTPFNRCSMAFKNICSFFVHSCRIVDNKYNVSL